MSERSRSSSSDWLLVTVGAQVLESLVRRVRQFYPRDKTCLRKPVAKIDGRGLLYALSVDAAYSAEILSSL